MPILVHANANERIILVQYYWANGISILALSWAKIVIYMFPQSLTFNFGRGSRQIKRVMNGRPGNGGL